MMRGLQRSVFVLLCCCTLILAEGGLRGPPCPADLPKLLCAPTTAPKDWSPGEGQFKLPLNSTLDYVRKLLQEAVEVEHSTVPVYLTALYSLKNTTTAAGTAVRSVVIEEMLHMTTACNVLNAIGGAPDIDSPDFIPKFPLMLPLINVSAQIRKFEPASVENFMLIERPPDGDRSISKSYVHIVDLLTELVAQHGEKQVFTGDPSLQVEANASPYPSAPYQEIARKVHNLADATRSMIGVADQGGGCPVPGQQPLWPNVTNTSAGELGGGLAHFARFTEVLKGKKYGPGDTPTTGPRGEKMPVNWTNVFSFENNPKVENFPNGSAARAASKYFASNYTALLAQLHNVFNGAPEQLMTTMTAMYALKAQAQMLMAMPDPRKGQTGGVGPSWEYVPSASLYKARHGKARPTCSPSACGQCAKPSACKEQEW